MAGTGINTSDTAVSLTDDAVTLALNGQELLVAESYEFHSGVLTQPSAFALRVGTGSSTFYAADFIQSYPPGTLFEIYVGNTLQVTGQVDGIEVEQSGDGATTVNFRGRDALACLHDAFIQVEKNYPNHSYVELTQAALDACGFKGQLLTTNTASRQKRCGTSILTYSEPDSSSVQIEEGQDNGIAFQQVQAKVGERWYHFLKRELDRAGLMLWADPEGNAVLSRPNPDQRPVYGIVRQRSKPQNAVTVKSVRYRVETTQRYSECLIYGRYGGKKYGPARAKGSYIDTEMTALGYSRPLVIHDVNISSAQQAAFLASRKLAESRREGWQLEYVVSAHTIEALYGLGPCVWTPDTLVAVKDDELGLDDEYYLEGVAMSRSSSGTETTLSLARIDDLLFGLSE